MLSCPHCDAKFTTLRGLGGHKAGKHGRKRKTILTVKCGFCKRRISRTPWKIKRRSGKAYCTQVCAKAALRRDGTLSMESHPNWKGSTGRFLCAGCGKEFKRNKKKGRCKFCSSKCAGKASTKPPVSRQCRTCKEPFTVRYAGKLRTYCSDKCSSFRRAESARLAELRAMVMLKAEGCTTVFRSSGSRGPFDVGGVAANGNIRLVQVKCVADPRLAHFRKEANQLLTLARTNSTIRAEGWIWKKGSGWFRRRELTEDDL